MSGVEKQINEKKMEGKYPLCNDSHRYDLKWPSLYVTREGGRRETDGKTRRGLSRIHLTRITLAVFSWPVAGATGQLRYQRCDLGWECKWKKAHFPGPAACRHVKFPVSPVHILAPPKTTLMMILFFCTSGVWCDVVAACLETVFVSDLLNLS